MNVQFVKVYPDRKVRETPWIVACPTCQFEREVGYPQIHNIKKGKSTGDCRKCAEAKTERDMSGLELGRRYWPDRKVADHTKNKEILEIIHTFGNGCTKETREKMSKSKYGKRGEETSRWEGGKTLFSQAERCSIKYKEFRAAILKRDEYKCVLCSSNERLEMDHIQEWCNYIELRYVSTNCRTLCHDCHTKTDNYKHKANKKSE